MGESQDTVEPKLHDETVDKPSLKTLREACKVLNEQGVRHFIVGSLAIGAITGEPIVDNKDVDILIPVNLEDARTLLGEVGLIKTRTNRAGVDLLINQFVVFNKSGEPFLRYKNYEIQAPNEVFTEYPACAYGVNFNTLPPPTLFHLYLIGGSFRSGDWSNALKLGRWLKEHDDSGLSESQFAGFHQYANARQKKYPLDAYLWKLDRERNVLHRPSIVSSIKNTCPWITPTLKKAREAVLGHI